MLSNQSSQNFNQLSGRPLFIDFEPEESFTEAELRLQHSQRLEAIGMLTAGVAHDFNNLLTAIIGNTQIALRNARTDAPVQNNLHEVEKACHLAVELTSQILAFSRSRHLNRKGLNVNDTILAIIKMLECGFGKRLLITLGL